MPKAILWVLIVGCVVMFGVSAEADCWFCNQYSCCEEAYQGSWGRGACFHGVACLGTCVCYNCVTDGSFCDGSAPAQCENINQACEEHQALRVIPHGDAIDLELLTSPGPYPSPLSEDHSPAPCRSV